MPLPPNEFSASRRELHLRQIEMRGFERDDGLFDIEGRVNDRKPRAFKSPAGERHVGAGEFIHDMWLRITVDRDLVVQSISSVTDASPYPVCQRGNGNLDRIVGMKIGSGWSSEVKRRLGGAQCCTHLMELLIPMATAAFQSLSFIRLSGPDRADANGRPLKIDSCFAYSSNSAVVARRWPSYYTGQQTVAEQEVDLRFPTVS